MGGGLLFSLHGRLYAAQRADELLALGTVTGAKTWLRILVEIEPLRKLKPEGGVN